MMLTDVAFCVAVLPVETFRLPGIFFVEGHTLPFDLPASLKIDETKQDYQSSIHRLEEIQPRTPNKCHRQQQLLMLLHAAWGHANISMYCGRK